MAGKKSNPNDSTQHWDEKARQACYDIFSENDEIYQEILSKSSHGQIGEATIKKMKQLKPLLSEKIQDRLKQNIYNAAKSFQSSASKMASPSSKGVNKTRAENSDGIITIPGLACKILSLKSNIILPFFDGVYEESDSDRISVVLHVPTGCIDKDLISAQVTNGGRELRVEFKWTREHFEVDHFLYGDVYDEWSDRWVQLHKSAQNLSDKNNERTDAMVLLLPHLVDEYFYIVDKDMTNITGTDMVTFDVDSDGKKIPDNMGENDMDAYLVIEMCKWKSKKKNKVSKLTANRPDTSTKFKH